MKILMRGKIFESFGESVLRDLRAGDENVRVRISIFSRKRDENVGGK